MAAKAQYTISGPLDPATRAPVTAKFGQTVAFTTDAPDSDYPWLEVQAHSLDDGHLLYSALKGTFPTYYDPGLEFQLGPTPSWPAGAAEGSATLFLSVRGTRRKVLTEITFPIEA